MALADHSEGSLTRPYPPSWMDRFFAWVERLPGPYWWPYLAAGLLLTALTLGIHYLEGRLGDMAGPYVLNATLGPYAFWLLHYLKRSMGDALEAVRPVMRVGPEPYQRTVYQATHDPALPILLCTLVGFGLWAMVSFGAAGGWAYEATLASKLTVAICWLLSILTFSTVFYQVSRLLVLTRRILDLQVQIHLLGHQPLQALPAVFAQAAVLTSFITLAALFLFPGGLLSVFLNLTPTLFCTGALVVSVQGVHARLVAEKRERMLQTSRQLDELSTLLHKAIDERSFAEVEGVNKSIVALQNELNMLEKAPTWPWNPDTVRILLTAILLPILVWIAQRILGRVGL